jgi:hypothetical protein
MMMMSGCLSALSIMADSIGGSAIDLEMLSEA